MGQQRHDTSRDAGHLRRARQYPCDRGAEPRTHRVRRVVHHRSVRSRRGCSSTSGATSLPRGSRST